jgi:acyl carrier protein/uncharacterized membrane protein
MFYNDDVVFSVVAGQEEDLYKGVIANLIFMIDTTTIELKDIDSDDLSDVLAKVEVSFGFKFGESELKDVKTFGELCDIISSKIRGDNSNDCTTQQAFYKVRNTIANTLLIDKNGITPETALQNIFQKRNRRFEISQVEDSLGFKAKILRPKHWITTTQILMLLISLIGLFFFWKVSLIALIFSIAGIKLADKYGNEFNLQTAGQFAEKISREHYMRSRRNTSTINRNEIIEKVKELFSSYLCLDENSLTKEATFV